MLAGEVTRGTELLGGVLSAVLGVLLIVAAVLGPMVTGRIQFHMSDDALAQYVGGELVTLVLALVLIGCTPLWLAGRPSAAALTAGACAYVIYTFATVVAGQEYGRYPGNAEAAFLLYAAISACAVLLLVSSGRVLLAVGGFTGVPHRAARWLLVVMGALFALLWLAQLAAFYRSGPSEEYNAATVLFWVIKYLDLGIVIPLLVLIGLVQRHPSTIGDAAAVTALGFVTWLLVAILLMAVEMVRKGTAGASWVLVVGFALLAIPSALVWARWMVGISRST